ncbi:MAG TPA: indole-3-glycerol phosphate synthase TrpC [Acidimicrobiales bacterium]
MATYLDEILHHHRARVAVDDRDWHLRAEAVRAPVPSLLAALSDSANTNVKVIAEVKRRSPSKGWLHEDLDVAQLARAYADGGATAISVLTDAEHFSGSLEDLETVARTVNLPLLRKDFTVSENDVLDAADAGASAVLLIVAALSDDELRSFLAVAHDAGLDAIVEVHDGDEAQRSLDSGARIIGVNQRNLHTFDVDRDNAARVIQSLPTSIVTVCESGLGSPEDVAHAAEAGFDAVLVGESFVTAKDVAKVVQSYSTVPLVRRD